MCYDAPVCFEYSYEIHLEMYLKYFIFQVIFIAICIISCVNCVKKSRNKQEYNNAKSLWKKEYENELTDAVLSSKSINNVTRLAQSAEMTDNEVVIEKLMDTITSSKKYRKKVDSIDFRLNRLDIEVHEKTNSIIKLLTEIRKILHDDPYTDKIETALNTLRSDINDFKSTMEKKHNMNQVDDNSYAMDSTLNSKLTFLETNIKNILSGVESIGGVIDEVQSRQHSRSFPKLGASLNGGLDTTLLNEFRKVMHDQRTRKCDCKTGRFDRSERYPTDCQEIQMQGFNVSGIYKIKPDDLEPFYVLCDLTTAGGGWTVIQNRYDGSQDFFKGWMDYKYGFGNLAGEFWLGLEKISYLTNQKLYELRIEIETHDLEAYAGYSVFTVGPEHEGFRISTLGTFFGNAVWQPYVGCSVAVCGLERVEACRGNTACEMQGDSLSYHAGQKFSTPDVDNDEWKDGACALEHGGAWWYKECEKSNLNGKYPVTANESRGQSIYWMSFKGPNYPLTKTKMMIRPLPASKPADYETNRKRAERQKIRPISEKHKGIHLKGTYESSRAHPYRYDDAGRGEAFFTNYA